MSSPLLSRKTCMEEDLRRLAGGPREDEEEVDLDVDPPPPVVTLYRRDEAEEGDRLSRDCFGAAAARPSSCDAPALCLKSSVSMS